MEDICCNSSLYYSEFILIWAEVGRGGHGMGRFLAIYNLVKDQKSFY